MDGIRDDRPDGSASDGGGAPARIRIGIVDNDPYAVAVLSTMIARMDARFECLWTCELGAVAISRCLNRARRPDVLVTDMSMNDVPGTEVCRAIRVKRADVGVVGVTSYAVDSFMDEATRCGMQALVGKTDLAGLAVAIRRAAQGLATNDAGTDADPASGGPRFLDAAEAHTLLEDAAYDVGHGALSPKERDVLRLYADGLTTREIADRLGVGTPTIATFERRALAKLGARSRAQAISICVRRHVF
ncbi:response regulator transcription factor [Bifidobacterium aerophilum]|uniref:Response regulator n=1 Tax=Bifidobacterium aerophilum TaxID=1798155 RepID=A0A6N9Z3F0_9BIFI|nr:response regulator transcription factor [Bifidobacterium aerophilum]NEG89006.1 response regulator [Bifidobacterium aerophilum]